MHVVLSENRERLDLRQIKRLAVNLDSRWPVTRLAAIEVCDAGFKVICNPGAFRVTVVLGCVAVQAAAEKVLKVLRSGEELQEASDLARIVDLRHFDCDV